MVVVRVSVPAPLTGQVVPMQERCIVDIEHMQVPSSSSVPQTWATHLHANRSLVSTASTRARSSAVSPRRRARVNEHHRGDRFGVFRSLGKRLHERVGLPTRSDAERVRASSPSRLFTRARNACTSRSRRAIRHCAVRTSAVLVSQLMTHTPPPRSGFSSIQTHYPFQ